MVGMALVPAVRRGLLRVVSGDPVSVGWRVDAGASALVLELRAVGAAAPVELAAVLVERPLAERLQPEPPRGLVETSPSAPAPAGLSGRDWVTWTGSVPLEPGGTTRLEIRCGRRLAVGDAERDEGKRGDDRSECGRIASADSGDADRGEGVAGAPVAGRVAVVYRYRSVLSPMSSTAFVDVEL